MRDPLRRWLGDFVHFKLLLFAALQYFGERSITSEVLEAEEHPVEQDVFARTEQLSVRLMECSIASERCPQPIVPIVGWGLATAVGQGGQHFVRRGYPDASLFFPAILKGGVTELLDVEATAASAELSIMATFIRVVVVVPKSDGFRDQTRQGASAIRDACAKHIDRFSRSADHARDVDPHFDAREACVHGYHGQRQKFSWATVFPWATHGIDITGHEFFHKRVVRDAGAKPLE